ncbi:exonuclease domain-containing protein [Shewanella sp. 1CM18E]|uniref:3'-5' exonuclease n=1 Tax=Shewanella sp. 1CM18E TaxID=2929169 RepID=UPI0020BDE392|nr:3'-5' exonuclease [Shewanella sp. 1CM18E]MCK8044806.1 exonuclease domain-containing protein [Shewanella sp. 1CM18E]
MEFEYTRDGLRQVLDQHQYLVIIDVEHTCTEDGSIPVNEREIIEIGAVLLTTNSLSVVNDFSGLVRPVRHPQLSSFCANLTGISQSLLAKQDVFSHVFKQFQAWLPADNDYIFCSWGSYDLIQINIDCDFHQLQGYKPATVVNLKKAFSKTQRVKPQVGLKKALELSGNSMEGAHHRGLIDAQNTIKLLPFIFGEHSLVEHGLDKHNLVEL